jgi:hypothetical protein
MRYFVVSKDGKVLDKRAFSGDDAKITAMVAEFIDTHPELNVLEVDEGAFDATVLERELTKEQKDWAAFKATSPTAQQAIVYLAKYLGLE